MSLHISNPFSWSKSRTNRDDGEYSSSDNNDSSSNSTSTSATTNGTTSTTVTTVTTPASSLSSSCISSSNGLFPIFPQEIQKPKVCYSGPETKEYSVDETYCPEAVTSEGRPLSIRRPSLLPPPPPFPLERWLLQTGLIKQRVTLPTQENRKVFRDYDFTHFWSKSYKIFVTLIITLVSFLAFCGWFFPIVCIPHIQSQYNFEYSHLPRTMGMAVAMCAIAVGSLVALPIVEKFGRRPAAFIAMFLAFGGQFASFAANSMYGLTAIRAIQFAGVQALCLTFFGIISDLWGYPYGQAFEGICNCLFNLGPVLGLVAGTLIAKRFEWKGLLILLGVKAGLALILLMFLPETHPDIVGNGTHGQCRILHYPFFSKWYVEPSGPKPPGQKKWPGFANLSAPWKCLTNIGVLMALLPQILIGTAVMICLTTGQTALFRYHHYDGMQIAYCMLAWGLFQLLGCGITSIYEILAIKRARLRYIYQHNLSPNAHINFSYAQDFPLEQTRLPTLLIHPILYLLLIMACTALLHIHPCLSIIILGAAGYISGGFLNTSMIYICDIFPGKVTSAISMAMFLRFSFSAATMAGLSKLEQKGMMEWSLLLISCLIILGIFSVCEIAYAGEERRIKRLGNRDPDGIDT